jgi:hypothetical protein
MAEIKWNFDQYDEIIANSSMSRIRAAADALCANMRQNCYRSYANRRPAYKSGPYAGKAWTARDMDIMAKTIRVVELNNHHSGLDNRNVRVYAGNWKTWWATQMEFGRGDWKGGAHPFMRPAIQAMKSQIQVILESGNAETFDSGYRDNG